MRLDIQVIIVLQCLATLTGEVADAGGGDTDVSSELGAGQSVLAARREISALEQLDATAVSTCSGNGVLVPREDNKNVLDCNCERGFTGAFCQVELKSAECRRNTARGCQYHCHCHGTCMGEADTAECVCESGWAGVDCGDRVGWVGGASPSTIGDRGTQSLLSIDTTVGGTLDDVIRVSEARSRNMTYCIRPQKAALLIRLDSEPTVLHPRGFRGPKWRNVRAAMMSATFAWSSKCGVEFHFLDVKTDECTPSVDRGIDFVVEIRPAVQVVSHVSVRFRALIQAIIRVIAVGKTPHPRLVQGLARASRTDVGSISKVITQMRSDGVSFSPKGREENRILQLNDAAALDFVRVRAVLIHEIGHIVGFRHEHLSAPKDVLLPEYCREETTQHLRRLSPYDAHSVMAYPGCGGTQSWQSFTFDLSRGDVAGCQTIYGNSTAMTREHEERTRKVELVCERRMGSNREWTRYVCAADIDLAEHHEVTIMDGGYGLLWTPWMPSLVNASRECPIGYRQALRTNDLLACADVVGFGGDAICTFEDGMSCMYWGKGVETIALGAGIQMLLDISTKHRSVQPQLHAGRIRLQCMARYLAETREETVESFVHSSGLQTRRIHNQVTDAWGIAATKANITQVSFSVLPDRTVGDWIATFRNLEFFTVHSLLVTLSPRVCELQKLRTLRLYSFDGEIPACVGSMPSLTQLTVRGPLVYRLARGLPLKSSTPRFHPEFAFGGPSALQSLTVSLVNATGASEYLSM
eukprot:GFYU01009253.1.p1 GENE.GFYU01009253.1~~GFYU01009253.1.p1  ORF type:complete len:753 (-),score=25.94 GFYU01009253.1:1456-3714(-)